MTTDAVPVRKIIHVDMDCFYAAIEIRDNPSLADKPVAVGGSAETRGVLCTSNYIARRYGVRSAMPTSTAMRLCKDLILLPVNIAKYQAVAQRIHAIFQLYSDKVEPLSLDEAYIDVTNSPHCQGSATLIAQEIRKKIFTMENLTASAGVAPNKFLAKIASGWKKPNGLFVIRPHEIGEFIQALPVAEIFGVGKVTAEKLHNNGFKTCLDLQKLSLNELSQQFGKLGERLYEQCRGQDTRPVEPNRVRKSLSVEHTFAEDIHNNSDICLGAMKLLHDKLVTRVKACAAEQPLKSQFIKIKYHNFRQVTAEAATLAINFDMLRDMFLAAYAKNTQAIRLLGVGVHFSDKENKQFLQHTLF